jgi:hypothetical protein
VAEACTPSTWEGEAGRSRVQGQPVPHTKRYKNGPQLFEKMFELMTIK